MFDLVDLPSRTHEFQLEHMYNMRIHRQLGIHFALEFLFTPLFVEFLIESDDFFSFKSYRQP